MAKKKKKADVKPKKRGRAADFDEDDDFDDAEDDFDDDFDDAPAKPPSRNDAYTGMLLISLVCLIVASVFLMLDSGDLAAASLSNPNVIVPALTGPPAAAPSTTGL